MNNLQRLAVQILNSNYKILFSLFIYCLFYSCFYLESNVAFCMNISKMAILAESKAKDEIINDLKRELEFLKAERNLLSLDNKALRDENLDLSLETLRLRPIESEYKIIQKRNCVLEVENMRLKTELRKEKIMYNSISREAKELKQELVNLREEQILTKRSAQTIESEFTQEGELILKKQRKK